MTTRATIERYFDRLASRGDWESVFADDMTFTSYTSPVREVKSKTAFLSATKRFYSSIGSVQVRELTVDADRAVALTRYEIRPPNGSAPFTSDVAEIFRVKDDAISSLEIYFDSAPFPK
jgi:ketosteroid isomerase-like protein